MSSKLRKLEEKYDQNKANSEKAAAEIAAIESKLAEMKKEAASIAAAGDVELYTEAKKRIDQQQTLLEVKKAVRDSNPSTGITAAEALAAWKQYYPEAVKERKAVLDKYIKLREELLGQFVELVKKQNSIYATRDKCKEMCGGSITIDGDISIPMDLRCDQNYFYRCGLHDIPKTTAVGTVLNLHSFSEQLAGM